jgi:hypothetical protein
VNKILMPIVSGSRARNFLRSDLFTELRSNADIVIASPAFDDPAFLRGFRDSRVFLEPYCVKAARRKLEFLLQTLETWFPNPGYASTDTYRIIVGSLSQRSTLGKLRALELYFYRRRILLGYARVMRELVRRLDFSVSPPGAYQQPFERHNPALVFTDYPFHYSYRPVLKIARRRRIPVVCFVSSWDNLTSKGELPVKMNKLIVWNEIMRREAMQLYGYDSEDVLVSGAPQFDIYFRKGVLTPRDQFLRQVGLDPKKKVITYCTLARSDYQNLELEVIKILLGHIRQNGFKEECQLLIRIHPGAAFPDRFLELQGQDVYVDCPGYSQVWVDGWDPEGADMARLGNIIQSSDVVVNVGSTITIDASCLDRPVVNIAFGADRPRACWDSLPRRYGYTHYMNVLRTGGVRLARSKHELLEYVSAYLKDPDLDADGRKRIVAEQCYYTDGRSGLRVAHFVLDFLRSITTMKIAKTHLSFAEPRQELANDHRPSARFVTKIGQADL